jgi:hypothetical protein
MKANGERMYKEPSILALVLPSGQKLTLGPLAITLEVVPFHEYVSFPAFLPFLNASRKSSGLENRDYGRTGSAALTMRHPSIRKSWH